MKGDFKLFETIYKHSPALQNYHEDVIRLQNFIKLKNFDLILEELGKLMNYLDDKVFFQALENVVRNDLLKFVDQTSQSLLDSLDLNHPMEFLLQRIQNLQSLNSKFHRNESKLLLQIFEIMLTGIKQFLNESVVQSKETFKRSKVRIKYVGYLSYFKTEVESSSGQEGNRFLYYQLFFQQYSKFCKICELKQIVPLLSPKQKDSTKVIFELLLKCLDMDTKSLIQTGNEQEILSLTVHLGPITTEGKPFFDLFGASHYLEFIQKQKMEVVSYLIKLYSKRARPTQGQQRKNSLSLFFLSSVETFSSQTIKTLDQESQVQTLKKLLPELLKSLLGFYFEQFQALEEKDKKTQIYQYLESLFFMKSELFPLLPIILKNAFKEFEQKTVQMQGLQNLLFESQRLFENEVFKLVFGDLIGLLYLMIESYFYSELLPGEAESYFKEKNPKLREGLLPQNEFEIKNLLENKEESFDWNLLTPRSIVFQIIGLINTACEKIQFSSPELINRFLQRISLLILSELKQSLKHFDLIQEENTLLLIWYEVNFILGHLEPL